MALIIGKLYFTLPLRSMVRLISNNVNSENISMELGINPNFTKEEQQKILNTLNNSNSNKLLNLSISETKIKNLKNYQTKYGPFKSLNDILEVEGLGIKLAKKICDQIINETPENAKKPKNNGNRKIKQLISPVLRDTSDLKSAVGIHLGPTGVSWAKLSKSNNFLNNWGFKDLSLLPKKMLPNDTFDVAIDVLDKIPSGDIYIFEGTANMSLSGQKQPATVFSYNQQLELLSMLLALINTSSKHNLMLQNFQDAGLDQVVENKVFFLKSKLPARLFKTLVGNERVSAVNTINQLINESDTEFTLSTTPINFDVQLKNDYLAQPAASKELLGQALMLIIAFMDLCVYKNINCLSSVGISMK